MIKFTFIACLGDGSRFGPMRDIGFYLGIDLLACRLIHRECTGKAKMCMFFKDDDAGSTLKLSICDVPSVLSGIWLLVCISYLSAYDHRLTNASSGHF